MLKYLTYLAGNILKTFLNNNKKNDIRKNNNLQIY